MQTLTVRVDDDLAGRLRQLAAEDEVATSAILRRALKAYVRTTLPLSEADQSLARAREGVGRVR